MIGRTNTGGGGGLNFQVVGGIIAPSNPRENTIWVNTATKITSWFFSATEPENLAEGMVWISVGTSSEVAFNALKKNGIEVYPISAKQYIDGELVSVETQSYQNGEWVEWIPAGALYYNGDEREDVTGGWALSTNYGNAPSHGDKLIKTEYSMIFESHFVGGVSYAYGFLRANNKINLDNINSLELTVKSVSLDNPVNPIVLCAKSIDIANTTNVVASIALTDSGKQTFTLDVSALSGNYYVGIEADDENGGIVEVLQIVAK